MNDELKKAIQTLDEVIPEPNNPMVDLAHIHIAGSWAKVKEALSRRQGKWIEADLDNSLKTCDKCHCGMMAYDAEKLGFRFCPWCGAEMENGA